MPPLLPPLLPHQRAQFFQDLSNGLLPSPTSPLGIPTTSSPLFRPAFTYPIMPLLRIPNQPMIMPTNMDIMAKNNPSLTNSSNPTKPSLSNSITSEEKT